MFHVNQSFVSNDWPCDADAGFFHDANSKRCRVTAGNKQSESYEPNDPGRSHVTKRKTFKSAVRPLILTQVTVQCTHFCLTHKMLMIQMKRFLKLHLMSLFFIFV